MPRIVLTEDHARVVAGATEEKKPVGTCTLEVNLQKTLMATVPGYFSGFHDSERSIFGSLPAYRPAVTLCTMNGSPGCSRPLAIPGGSPASINALVGRAIIPGRRVSCF